MLIESSFFFWQSLLLNVKQTMEAVNSSVPTYKEDHENAAAGLGSLWLVIGEIVKVSSYVQY